MEKVDDFNKNSDIEFYIVRKSPGNRFLIAAVGSEDGGYIYFGLQYSHSSLSIGKPQILKISQIDNIVELCGSPNVHVLAVDKCDPRTMKLYNILSSSIQDYFEKTEKEQAQKNKDNEKHDKSEKPVLM